MPVNFLMIHVVNVTATKANKQAARSELAAFFSSKSMKISNKITSG